MALYFLGVDGGQSSTTALVANETGQVLGMGRGGPCNHVSGEEARTKFNSAIGGCVTQALEEAGLSDDTDFEGACLGFSGGPADKETLVHQLFTIRHALVTNDALIALVGATAGAPGVITIAGTGSISYGRNAEGKVARVGGWGYVFGDEGGGFDLTRQALRAALRQEEGWGPETMLYSLLLEATGASNANELLHRCYTPSMPRPKIAALSQVVERAAAAGDLIAGDILDVAAQQLASLTIAARRMIFADGVPARVSYICGVFRSERIRSRFETLVRAQAGNDVAPPRYGPAAGALIEAFGIAGVQVELRGAPEEK
jgi:N-acetylglucosamine kinase-like BadF-type ATPase